MGKAFNLFRRLFFILAGIVIILTAAPHKDPWNMSRVIIDEQTHLVHINPIIFNQLSFTTTPFAIFAWVFSSFLCLLVFTLAGRKVLAGCLRRNQLFVFFIFTILFLMTLIPSQEGLPIVLYLAISSVGFALFITGSHSLLLLSGKHRAVKVIGLILEKCEFCLFESQPRWFLTIAFLVTFLITNLISYYIFEHIPHVQDSVVQVFHGKIFSKGYLTAPSHPLKEFFDFSHIINNGQWYSPYPPGHIMMLMVGFLIGMPWIVNPFLGSLTPVVFYFIGKSMFSEKVGRISLLLGVCSPFLMFMSSEFMSHPTALFFLSIFLLFYVKTFHLSRWWHPAVSGGFLGMALITRPMTAFAMSIPFAGYAFWCLIKNDRRKHLMPLTLMLLTCLVFMGLLFAYNYLTNADPFLFGHEAKWGPQHNPGFGQGIWGENHTPRDGIEQNLNNLNAFNKYLFEWPLPSLFFVLIPLSFVRRNKWDYLLVLSFFSLSAAYFFFWYQDWCFGPRFLFEGSIAAIILSARGLVEVPRIVKEYFQFNLPQFVIGRSVSFLIVSFFLVSFIFHIPPLIDHYSQDYWRVNSAVVKAVNDQEIENAVVFVKSYYGAVFAENDPFFDDDILFVRDMGHRNQLMMNFYPDRRYFLAYNQWVNEVYSSN